MQPCPCQTHQFVVVVVIHLNGPLLNAAQPLNAVIAEGDITSGIATPLVGAAGLGNIVGSSRSYAGVAASGPGVGLHGGAAGDCT